MNAFLLIWLRLSMLVMVGYLVRTPYWIINPHHEGGLMNWFARLENSRRQKFSFLWWSEPDYADFPSRPYRQLVLLQFPRRKRVCFDDLRLDYRCCVHTRCLACKDYSLRNRVHAQFDCPDDARCHSESGRTQRYQGTVWGRDNMCMIYSCSGWSGCRW